METGSENKEKREEHFAISTGYTGYEILSNLILIVLTKTGGLELPSYWISTLCSLMLPMLSGLSLDLSIFLSTTTISLKYRIIKFLD